MSPLARAIARLFDPLALFYAEAGSDLPQVERIEPEAMPQPYRRLLVHERDMTSTLEAYFGQILRLRMIRTQEIGDALHRQVVLVGDDDGKPAEFGAIKIELNRFADEPRRRIEEGVRPLGTLLKEFGITYRCRPNGYFRVESDPITEDALGLTASCTLYGRHNLVHGDGDELLAEVVEILPPLETE